MFSNKISGTEDNLVSKIAENTDLGVRRRKNGTWYPFTESVVDKKEQELQLSVVKEIARELGYHGQMSNGKFKIVSMVSERAGDRRKVQTGRACATMRRDQLVEIVSKLDIPTGKQLSRDNLLRIIRNSRKLSSDIPAPEKFSDKQLQQLVEYMNGTIANICALLLDYFKSSGTLITS